jgi:hypothetical protein
VQSYSFVVQASEQNGCGTTRPSLSPTSIVITAIISSFQTILYPSHSRHEAIRKPNQTSQMIASIPYRASVTKYPQRRLRRIKSLSLPFHPISRHQDSRFDTPHNSAHLNSASDALGVSGSATFPSLSHPVPKIVTTHFPPRVPPSRLKSTNTHSIPLPNLTVPLPVIPHVHATPSTLAQTGSETPILASTPQPQRTCLFEPVF